MKPPSNRPGNRGSDRPRSSGGPQRPRDPSKPSFGDRPRAPSDRPAGDKPRFERSGDKPRFDRPAGDKPRVDRAAGDKPHFARSGDKPHFARSGDKPRFDRPRGDAPRSDKPRSERPQQDGPRPERPRADAPQGERRMSLRPSQAPATPQPARGPAGTVWLFGIHAVAAALANPARLLRRLMLTDEAEPEVMGRLKGGLPIVPERTDRARLEQLLGRGVVHQGVALLTDPLPQLSLQQALERPGPVLVLDQVTDPRNIGAIIRSAAAFGVACVVMQDRNAPEETGTMAKAASGALERLPVIRAVNIARTLIALRAAGLWIVGLDGAGPKLSGTALAQRRIALVLGSEGDGMRRLTRETCDEVAGIQMPGGTVALDSINVSAAAAVALYELTRTP